MDSPNQDNVDPKVAFRKPGNDVASRKYRRRSPVSGSSTSDGSPRRGSSPMNTKEDAITVSKSSRTRKDNELDRDFDRSQYGRGGDSSRHSDWNSRGFQRDPKRTEYSRYDKHGDGKDDKYGKASYHPNRESRASHNSDHTRLDSERSRSRDYVDRYPEAKYGRSGYKSKDKEKDLSSVDPQKRRVEDRSSYRAESGRRHANSKSKETERDSKTWEREDRDTKKDYYKNSDERRSDRPYSRDESRGYQKHPKEPNNSELKDVDSQKLTKGERRKFDDQETKEDRHFRVPRGQDEERLESTAKKMKSLSSEKLSDNRNNASGDNVLAGKSNSTYSEVATDPDAAKVAAIKAAELVNKNLVGTGYMTAEQKKKLLWGSKKTAPVEESTTHRWDSVLLGDPERQEKFNKLMGVKNENKPENQDPSQVEKQKELQLDLEKQYTAGLRRRDGRTVGLGL